MTDNIYIMNSENNVVNEMAVTSAINDFDEIINSCLDSKQNEIQFKKMDIDSLKRVFSK